MQLPKEAIGPVAPSNTQPDLETARKKYRYERDRRLRRDGATQYQRAAGEFGYYAKDPYTSWTERPPVEDRVEVLVIGGGFGGLLTGAKLRQQGVESLRIMDEAGDFGGAWYWNRYPGIHCDIESYVYMPLLEEVGYVPRWRYAPGEEIRSHAVAIAKTFDLYRDVLFQTRATELQWDGGSDEWVVRTDRGDLFRAHHVVVSSGTLSQPKLPGIAGIETFKGHTFHTSRWDYDYTGGDQTGGLSKLADKRVAVVGTGATGIQVIPHLGRATEQLYVFQRTPSTIDVRDNRPTDPAWAATLRPNWQQERMENFLRIVSGEHVDEDLTNDGWTSTAELQRNVITGAVDTSFPADRRSLVNEILDLQKMNQIRARVDDVIENPEIAELLKPWYRYMCKRPGFSDEYLPTFNRPNVTLVDTADFGGITRVSENSMVVGTTEYEVDCIIFATGFEAGVSGVISGTLPVYGCDGIPLLDAWSQGPRTLHGFYSHGFPNLFHLGAIQNANSVNFVHILQEQAQHIAKVIAAAAVLNSPRVEPTAEAEEAWIRTVQESALENQEFQAECTPGYYNNEGAAPQQASTFGPGPIAFHRLLAAWRRDSISDVLEPR
ncbi:NAD(P)/FAD-dependent oxidoreductase [Arthrobacter sp. Z1-9]